MYILNVEDDVFKHNDICKVLQNCGVTKIDWAENLEDAIKMVSSSEENNTPYDLIITDMWYPAAPGGRESQCGEVLIKKISEMNLNIPIILCSSVNYSIPDILDTVYYSEKADWEEKLTNLITK